MGLAVGRVKQAVADRVLNEIQDRLIFFINIERSDHSLEYGKNNN